MGNQVKIARRAGKDPHSRRWRGSARRVARDHRNLAVAVDQALYVPPDVDHLAGKIRGCLPMYQQRFVGAIRIKHEVAVSPAGAEQRGAMHALALGVDSVGVGRVERKTRLPWYRVAAAVDLLQVARRAFEEDAAIPVDVRSRVEIDRAIGRDIGVPCQRAQIGTGSGRVTALDDAQRLIVPAGEYCLAACT
jgi:hypothetical protein